MVLLMELMLHLKSHFPAHRFLVASLKEEGPAVLIRVSIDDRDPVIVTFSKSLLKDLSNKGVCVHDMIRQSIVQMVSAELDEQPVKQWKVWELN